jgi:hypothetical protein
MSWPNGTREGPDADSSGMGTSASTASILRRGVAAVGRRLSFWSAIVLPLVAIALIVVQPPGWLVALLALFAVNGLALFFGHCHDREC